VAVVTGAAHGIGRAVAQRMMELGAVVVGLDSDPVVVKLSGSGFVGLECDVTDGRAVERAMAEAVRSFGGVDLLVSNAGFFPDAVELADLDDGQWSRVLALNLDAHHKVLRAATPYLLRGHEPSVVFVGSKNAAAPGPGVGAYSVAKAGLTQLMRVAALELGERGVRVNAVHPDAVFDTKLWSTGKIEARARSYGVTVDEYKRRNILKREVHARDVANAVARLLSPELGLTTGAQLPVDGGNVRVI
ncbi:MAG TPA: SDR family oxidoreductase, partial [Myxococcota bacterium]|nr:SDR family oxidoreductase [Myxococcota bacterium]